MNKVEQLKAFINDDMWSLAVKYHNGDMDSLMDSWTLSKSEVLDFVEKEDLKPDWIHTQKSSEDGVYLIKRSSAVYITYSQDRGKIDSGSLRSHPNFRGARNYLFSDLCEASKIK